MNIPLVYQLFRPEHRWVAMYGTSRSSLLFGANVMRICEFNADFADMRIHIRISVDSHSSVDPHHVSDERKRGAVGISAESI